MADELQPPPAVSLDDGSTARVVMITAPDVDQARALARALVDEGLAACVNIVPGLASIYRWEGQLVEDAEVLLLVKTAARRLPELAARVRELHPYDLPELVALVPREVEAGYLAWLLGCTESEEGRA